MTVGDLVARIKEEGDEQLVQATMMWAVIAAESSTEVLDRVRDLLPQLRHTVEHAKTQRLELYRDMRYFLNAPIFTLLTVDTFTRFMATLDKYEATRRLVLPEYQVEDYLKTLEELSVYSGNFRKALAKACSDTLLVSNEPFTTKEVEQFIHFCVFSNLALQCQSADVIHWAHMSGLQVEHCVTRDISRKLGVFAPDIGEFTTLDISLHMYQVLGDKTEPVRLLTLVAALLDEEEAFAKIEALTLTELKQVKAEHLAEVCKGIIRGGRFPLITTLHVAGLFRRLAQVYLSDSADYMVQYAAFTTTVLNLLDDFASDQIAFLFLDEENPREQTALSVALATNNTALLSHPRVTRLFDYLWGVPDFMALESLGEQDRTSAYRMLLFHPKDYFRLPLGKFIIHTFNYMLFLALFSYFIAWKSVPLDAAFSGAEALVYAMAAGFTASALGELSSEGPEYFASEWNVIDSFLYLSFVVAMVARGLALASQSTSAFLTLVYRLSVTSICVLLWVRMLYIFVIHPTLGPLQRVIFRLTADIRNFVVLLAVFWFSFTSAFYYLLHDWSEDFADWTDSLLTTLVGMLGQFDFEDLFRIPNKFTRGFAQLAYCLFLSLGLIVLLNLLIAMMTKTYASVKDDSARSFLFEFAKLTHEYDKRPHYLPPPLAALVYLWVLPLFAMIRVCCIQSRTARKESKDDQFVALELQPLEEDLQAMKEEVIVRLSAEDMASDDLVELVDALEPRHLRTVVQEFAQFSSWRCGYCLHWNNYPTFHILLQYLKERDPTVESQSIGLVSTQSRLCINCMRLKHPISSLVYYRVQASYYTFMALLWVPLLLLSIIPYSITALKNGVLVKAAESIKDSIDEVLRGKRHAQLAEQDADLATEKRLWVARNLAQAASVDSGDIVQSLVALEKDIDALLTAYKERMGHAGEAGGLVSPMGMSDVALDRSFAEPSLASGSFEDLDEVLGLLDQDMGDL